MKKKCWGNRFTNVNVFFIAGDLSGYPELTELKLKPSALFLFEHEIFFYAEATDKATGTPVSTGIYKHTKFIVGPATPSVVKDDTESNAPFILFHAYARPS